MSETIRQLRPESAGCRAMRGITSRRADSNHSVLIGRRSRGHTRVIGLGLIGFAAAACASAPPAPAVAPAVPIERKLAWVHQLEDQRILRVVPPIAPVAPAPAVAKRAVAPAPPPSSSPDLTALVKDQEARVRRRAALAIGRVGLVEGLPALVSTLADPDPDVRAMAAFAIGLLNDPSAEAALAPLLLDSVPNVRGRVAEALGLIGAKGAAPAIGQMAAEYARSAQVATIAPDDETWPAVPEAEAFKLGLFALVRLKAYEALATAVLDGSRPVSAWWPVAYALQRIEDPRAAPALLQLLDVQGRYTPAFAARGLGALKASSAAEPLLRIVDGRGKAPIEVVVAAIGALAQVGSPAAGNALVRVVLDGSTHPNVRLEALRALGTLRAAEGLPVAQDTLTAPWPALRRAALRATAAIDQESFMFVLSGLEPDPDWRVRVTLAEVLGTLAPEVSVDRLRAMLNDADKRVIPSVLSGLARVRPPDLAQLLIDRLSDSDFMVRAAAARQLGEIKPEGGIEALRRAYQTAEPDAAYTARTAALAALAAYGVDAARETLELALADRDWAVRVRAAELLRMLDPRAETHQTIRPAPGSPAIPYEDPRLITPENSPHVFIETEKGTIEFELAVLDAPQTTRNFVALARKGFFNGLPVHRVVPNFVVQDGDPRGDGEGGPGYTIRDELNDRPFLRGTVGMALDWRDTGGSQFFITHSPQPHLDARYTAFGHVVNGMDVVDRIQEGDVIQRIRVWDGKAWMGPMER
jgi:cyclophilin family peptidyl-prolyl cis-trans isomerase/HEAT repeat protein